MKNSIIMVLICFLSMQLFGSNNLIFDEYFINKSMRIDYFQTGTNTEKIISLNKVKEEPFWAGSTTNLIDTLNLGMHIVRVYDEKSGKMIFSRGFNSFFQEWQTTDEAVSETYRTIPASAIIPYPKKNIRFTISSRNKKMEFVEEFSTIIDPNSRFVIHERPKYDFKVKHYLENGSPNEKVDILILPEGYTKKEMKTFRKDIKNLMTIFFQNPPFNEMKDKFNVWYIEAPSEESGVDDPRKGKFVNTLLNLSFNTFDIDRYVHGPDNEIMRNVAASAPYDQIYILMNTTKYGGGGIFNYCSICYNHAIKPENDWVPGYVFVHEFGHAFGGLADEYYSSNVAYNDFYPKGVEPWEPNITALNDPDNVKWKSLVEKDTPLPTPWDKKGYDSIPYGKSNIREEFLKEQKYWGKVGAFQGGGYVSEGIYRSYLDCRMFSKSTSPFCPVCQEAIKKVIRFYSE